MEPMALGSPPSSPSSPQINPNYLPSFLMGEQQAQTPNRPSNLSPTKNRSFGYKSPTTSNEQRGIHNRMFNVTSQEQSSFNLSNVGTEKTGPPALGLFDTLDTPDFANSTKIDPSVPSREPFDIRSPIADKSFSASNNPTYQRNLNDSLCKTNPFRKIDKSDSLWVTVLGFPPHAASLVLTQFSQFGTITDKKFPQEGNWVHLKYSSPHEVSRAMSFNGKIISNSIMVGVIPHQKNTSNSPQWENKENDEISPQAAVLTSPNRARSLTQPYVLPRDTAVLSPQNVPQRSTGLVTRAMEYVFGW